MTLRERAVWEQQYRYLANNCGTGAGGFQGGNSCAKGGGSGDTHTLEGGKIERETEKAILYKHPDFDSMWLPKSQIKIDGDKVEMPKWLANEKLQSKDFTPDRSAYSIVGETEKAYHLKVEYEAAHSSLQGTTSVFLPKSQVKKNADGSLSIPRWLAAAKNAEADGGTNSAKRGLAW